MSNCSSFFFEAFLPGDTDILPDIRISALGEDKVVSQSYSWNGMKRGNQPMCIWQYTVAGEGALTVGDNTFPVLPGDCMLLTIPDYHCYFLPPHSRQWHFQYMTLDGEFAMKIFRKMCRECENLLKLDRKSESAAVFREILRLVACGGWDAYTNTEYACRMICALARDLRQNAGRDHAAEAVRHAVAAAGNNCCITPEAMAKLVGYSKVYFETIFKKYMGVTPSVWLGEMKLQKALLMLRTTPLSIKEIAARCGFADSTYFCRVFRKKYGTTPGCSRQNQAF